MQTIEVQGWNVGFQKIQFTELLRGAFGYSLSSAKAATNAVLDRKTIELQVADDACGQLLPRLVELGANAALKK